MMSLMTMFHHFGTTIAPKQCIDPDLIHSQLTPSWESLPSSLNCAHFKRRQWEVKPVRGNPLPGVAPNHALTTAQANLPPSSELSILFYLLLLFYFQDKNHLTNTKWPLAAMSSCYECLGSLATITPVCRGPDLLFTSTNILEKDAA